VSAVSNGGLWNSGTYIPSVQNITAIAQGQTTTITTASTHTYVVGNTVTFQIPPQYVMRQLDKLVGIVLAITANTLTVNIDSSLFDAFSVPTPPFSIVVYDPAQVLPEGDYNTGYQVIAGTAPTLQIPGTFRNTYP
jgi:hypothetical protein